MTQKQRLEEIAKRFLGFPTLETRKMDSLDFREVAVWQVARALEAAFYAGAMSVTDTDILNANLTPNDKGGVTLESLRKLVVDIHTKV